MDENREGRRLVQRVGATSRHFDLSGIGPRALVDPVTFVGKDRAPHQREIGGAHIEAIHARRTALQVVSKLNLGMEAFEAGLPPLQERRHPWVATAAQHPGHFQTRLIFWQSLGGTERRRKRHEPGGENQPAHGGRGEGKLHGGEAGAHWSLANSTFTCSALSGTKRRLSAMSCCPSRLRMNFTNSASRAPSG